MPFVANLTVIRCTMSRNLNTVKTVTNAKRGSAKKSAKPYHHGALREALVAAAAEIIENEGPDGFSLRAAARKAGVSSAAPAYHFGDARGLLSASSAPRSSELRSPINPTRPRGWATNAFG